MNWVDEAVNWPPQRNWKLTFSRGVDRSDEGLTLKTSAFNFFMGPINRLFHSVDKSKFPMFIQMKATEQYFPVILLIALYIEVVLV